MSTSKPIINAISKSAEIEMLFGKNKITEIYTKQNAKSKNTKFLTTKSWINRYKNTVPIIFINV